MKLTHPWPVTTAGSDRSGYMSLPYLCSLLQETATMHADEAGMGYTELKEQGLQWVLSRQWIRMNRFPRWKEEVSVQTWPSKRKGIKWYRDFRINDSEGKELGVATSLWFVMDRETRRPRPAKMERIIPADDAEQVRDSELTPLPAQTAAVSSGTFRAAYHDIDVHDHINNIRYLNWMLDSIDPDFLRYHFPKEIEINFLAEGFLGDELEVMNESPAEIGESRLQSLRRLSDQTELCRMRSEWRSR